MKKAFQRNKSSSREIGLWQDLTPFKVAEIPVPRNTLGSLDVTMLLTRFDQESALGESLWAAANPTPPDCAWLTQVRSPLDYIKLGDVLQPLTGIQHWDCTITSPKETPKTRIAQQVSCGGFSAAIIQCPVVWPTLSAEMSSQQWCCGDSSLKDLNAKTVKCLQLQ